MPVKLPTPEGYTDEDFYSLDSHARWAIRNPDLEKQRTAVYRSTERVKVLKAENKKKNALEDIEKFVYNRWASYLKSQYSFSDEEYWKLFNEQNGFCAMCGKPETVERTLKVYGVEVRTKRLCVDHDHACCAGAKSCGNCIRGLLCHHCNTTLGSARDSIDTLQQGIAYLERGKK